MSSTHLSDFQAGFGLEVFHHLPPSSLILCVVAAAVEEFDAACLMVFLTLVEGAVHHDKITKANNTSLP